MSNDEIENKLRANVENGIKYLDVQIPDWRNEIDWDEFDFHHMQNCIAGQLRLWDKFNYTESIPFGFGVPSKIHDMWASGSLNPYDFLHNEWLKQRPTN